jgi:signal transduction histidine kinase
MRSPNLVHPVTGRLTVLVWAVLGALAVVLAANSIPISTVSYGVPLAAAFVLGLAQSALIPLAAIRPALAVGLSLIPLVVVPVLGADSSGAPWPVPVTTIIAQSVIIAVTALGSTWRTTVFSWLVSVLTVAVVIGTTPDRFDSLNASLGSAIPFTTISGGLMAIALLLAQRGRIRAQLERERRVVVVEQGRRELMEERNRIARELHDVVAHGMSVIQVQASSAKYRLPGLDAAVAAEFDDIGATARTSLAEMRQLLGVLRNEDSESGLGPQPGLFDIPTLVESSRRSGVPVSLDWSVSGIEQPPAAVALAAYRIVQESLSNAVRHAPGAATRVVVSRTEAAIEVSVENDAPASLRGQAEGRANDPSRPAGSRPAGSRPAGHGLVGMHERTQLVSGTVEHGPTASGGFRVVATLPIPSQSTAALRPERL